MKDDIVIVGAARTPVGAFNGAFANLPAHELGKVAITAALAARRGRGAAGVGSDYGPDSHRRRRPEPGPPGLDRGRHSGRSPRLGRQPAVRLGPAHGGARLSGDPQRRLRHRRRRRPGVHEHGAALRPSAQRREDGQLRDDRHHDQGRSVGRLQRLSHGQHGRERRPAVADHPGAAGRVRCRLAEQGGGRTEGRPLQGRDRAGHGEDPQGRRRRRFRRIPQARHHPRCGREAPPGLRQGRHRDRRQCLRHQ